MASIVTRMTSTTRRLATATPRSVSLVLFISLVIGSLIAAHNQHHQAEATILSSPQSASLTTAQISSVDPSQISPAASAGAGPKSSPAGPDQSAAELAAAAAAAQTPNSIGPASTSLNQVSQHHQMAAGQTQQVGPAASGSSSSPSRPLVLPRINIYASKSEIKKLLGLATQINYIENGVLNSYALGFQIPMGYALSDMIFTWQNLGPTNVNYFISLLIGNVHAVETPLINITRSGLIPRHEQVFKITLPCSGKVNDEVDFQILFNITGLVPVTQTEAAAGDNLSGSAAGSDDTAASEFQLTRAVQQQNEMLAAAVAANGNGQQAPAADQMQADQQDPRRPQMRMVSHVLAIKRKKICTLDPVPVHPVSKQSEVRPPNQVPSQEMVSSPHVRPLSAPAPRDQQSPTGDLKASPAPPLAEPSHQPTWTEAPPPQSLGLPPPLAPLMAPPVGGPRAKATPPPPPPILNPGKFVQGHTSEASHTWPDRQSPPAPTTSSRPINPADGTSSLIDAPRQQQQAAAAGNSLLFSLIVMSLIVSVALVALLLLGSSSSTAASRFGSSPRRSGPLDKLTALTNCIWRRTSAGSRAVNKCSKSAAGPITIKSGLIGTFGSSLISGHNSATTAHSRHHQQQHHHQHHHHHGHAKSNVSSISGLSTISAGLTGGKQQQIQNLNSLMGPFCHKQANYNTGFYHHYQPPPDLLIGSLSSSSNNTNTNTNTTTTNNNGNATTPSNFHQTHHSPSLTGPYQITMNNSQMTKLFLANPNNGRTYSIDNSYTPIVSSSSNFQTHHSDSGSVYQTIY